jgi:hypothetical protein
MFQQLQRDVQKIIDNVIELVYFMRGSLSYEEAMMRTRGERDRIGAFLQKRLKEESKRAMPNY